MSISELIEKFLMQQLQHIKFRTLIYYNQLHQFYIKNNIGKININKLTEQQLNSFILMLYNKNNITSLTQSSNNKKNDNKSLSYSTVKTIKSLLNRSLNFAYKNKILKKQIKCSVELKPKNVKKVEALTINEQCALENYILLNKKYYSYGIVISLHTGIRLGELLALKWDSVDFKNKSFVIKQTTCQIVSNGKLATLTDTPKTQSSLREIPLTNFIIGLLKDLKKYQNNNSQFVISKSTGKQVGVRAYQESFTRLLNKLNIKHYGFHSLRHTFATRCLEKNIDIKTISELLGHSNPTITLNRYVHTCVEHKRNALNLLSKNIKILPSA